MLEFSQSRKFLRKCLRSRNRISRALRARTSFLGWKRTEFQLFSGPRAQSREERKVDLRLFYNKMGGGGGGGGRGPSPQGPPTVPAEGGPKNCDAQILHRACTIRRKECSAAVMALGWSGTCALQMWWSLLMRCSDSRSRTGRACASPSQLWGTHHQRGRGVRPNSVEKNWFVEKHTTVQQNANQRQCTPPYGKSASLFSMPYLVEPQKTQ